MANVPKQVDNPAQAPGLFRDALTRQFLTCYIEDEAFTNALCDLYESQYVAFCEMDCIRARHTGYLDSALFLRWHDVVHEVRFGKTECLAGYADALRSLAKSWGLDLLPAEAGMDALQSALFWKADRPESNWHFTYHEMRALPFVRGVDYSTSPPSVVLIPELRWRPGYESPVKARAAIDEAARQAKAIVSEMVEHYAAAGYIFPPKSGRTDEHLRWLYRRIAYREPAYIIASDNNAEPTTVEKYTGEMKRALGIKRIPHSRRI